MNSPLSQSLRTIAAAPALALLIASFGVAQPPATDEQAAVRAYNAAAALQNNALHDRAAMRWVEFIKTYPNDMRADRAHYYLGICQLRTKKFAEAVGSFETLLKRWPKFTDADGAQYNKSMAMYQIAIAASKPEAYQKAAAAFAVVASQYPKSDFADDALYFQGDCWYVIGNRENAIAAFQSLVKSYPQSGQLARTLYDMGIAQQELGRVDQAAATFKGFLDRKEFTANPLAPEIRLRWALCLIEQEQRAEAEKQFKQLTGLKEFPLADYAMLQLAQSQMTRGDLQNAASSFSELPKRFPQSQYRWDALKSAGRCYYESSKFNEAISILNPVAMSNEPPALEASYWLGQSQLNASGAADALKTFDSAINRFKEGEFVPYVRYGRIDALQAIPERKPETPKLYEAFVAEFPTHPLATQAKYMASHLSLEYQQFDKARQLAEGLLSDPKFGDNELAGAVLFIAAESQLLLEPDQADSQSKAQRWFQQLISQHQDHPRTARARLRIAWIMQRQEKSAEAIKYLSAELPNLKEPADRAEAQLILGQCHATAGNHQQAVVALDAALAADSSWPQLDEVLLSSARSFHALKNYGNARDRANQLVSRFPKSSLKAHAFYIIGESAQSEQHHDEAIKAFTEVTKIPDNEFVAAAKYGLGAAYYAKEDFNQSTSWLDQVVASPDEGLKRRALYLRGMVGHRTDNFAGAVKDLKTFLQSPDRQPPDDASARYTLALCQISLKQFPDANKSIEDLLAAHPQFQHVDKAYYELGHSLLAQPTKATEAVAAFQQLTVKAPGSPLVSEAWFRIGQYHHQLASQSEEEAEQNQQHQQAAEAFGKGIEKATEPGLKEKLRYQLGETQFQLAQYEQAIASFTSQVAEAASGDYAGAGLFLHAECCKRLKRFDQALPLYIKVTQSKFPGVEQAQIDQYIAASNYHAGDCAAKLNNWPVSQTHFAQVVQKYATFSQIQEARYGLARAHQQQNQIDPALALYEQITKETETVTAAKARFMIGEIHFARNQLEDAIEQFLLVAVGYPYPQWQGLARFEAARCFAELKNVDRAVSLYQEMIMKHPDHERTPDAKKALSELQK